MVKIIKNKRGVSAVIANVLIVALIIMAVGILTVVIYNFFPRDLFATTENGVASIKAYYNNAEVPTKVLNTDVTMETVYVVVERNGKDQNWTGVNFIFSKDGETYTCERTNVPTKSGGIVYVFQSSILDVKPESVKVVPVLLIDGKEKNGPVIVEKIKETSETFSEKVSECGGFCCDASSDFPTVSTL